MNQTIRFLAPASLAIGLYCPKIHLQIHHQFNIVAKSSFLFSKFLVENCDKHSCINKVDYKFQTETLDTPLMTNKHDISCVFKKMQVNENIDGNINSLNDINTNYKESLKIKQSVDKSLYKEIRKWKKIDTEAITINPEESFIFKLLSFNILAQDLLETHIYLYRNHNRQVLPWQKRKPLLVQEILESGAHMVCLQEMQEDHLKDFFIPFKEAGFTYLYKKRTNNKKDGLLLMYKDDVFNLLEFSKVELYQTDIELLSRDNVGLIAKFALKKNPDIKFVTATTHLLYNPKRNDIRLGQVQLLFAEIERISFVENTSTGPRYLPIVISGDFNLEPYSGVYRFITEGSIEFVGKGRNLEQCDYCYLSNSLIPPHLYITDECQHFNVLSQRLSGKGSGKVMLKNTENHDALYNDKKLSEDLEINNLVDSTSTTYQKIEIAKGHYVTFSSGLLTHPFKLNSVYKHIKNIEKGKNEVTTFQNRWITVDYIFYSNMKLLEKYVLPTAEECIQFLPTIPNSIVGSDHLCLGVTFQLNKR